MVSRIGKRTPTKSIKDGRRASSRGHRRWRKSPAKAFAVNSAAAPSSTLLASFNRSLHSCHRRLVKIFSRLARITTPKSSLRRKGFKVLQKIPDDIQEAASFDALASARKTLSFEDYKPDVDILPPIADPARKTIFLDLDETLVCSKSDPPPEKFDFVVQPMIDGQRINFYILKRPGVDSFLRAISEKFEVIVFTAGLKEYALLVLDRLDPRGTMISHRLYRDSCVEVNGKYVKDLSRLGRDLKRVVIVDDNPNAYELQPRNAIPIRSFTDDLGDSELGKLMKFFEEGCDGFDDMREAVKLYLEERILIQLNNHGISAI